MAADLEKKYGTRAEIVQRDGGYYEIYVEGVQVFSKKTLGRFPDDTAEVIQLIDGANQ